MIHISLKLIVIGVLDSWSCVILRLGYLESHGASELGWQMHDHDKEIKIYKI